MSRYIREVHECPLPGGSVGDIWECDCERWWICTVDTSVAGGRWWRVGRIRKFVFKNILGVDKDGK